MLQIVHDLAPGASLAFATAFNRREVAFAQNIKGSPGRSPRGAGAKVIADDVAYFEEPFFQDGPAADAIGKVTGEWGHLLHGRGQQQPLRQEKDEIASWEAPEFRDSGTLPVGGWTRSPATETHCMDFNPGPGTDDTFGITVEARRHAHSRSPVGRTLERGQYRSRRLSAQRRRGEENCWPARPKTTSETRTAGRGPAVGKPNSAESQEVQLAINRCASKPVIRKPAPPRSHASSSPCWRTASG